MKRADSVSKVSFGVSAELLRSILDDQLDMVCRFRSDGTILFANRSYALSRDATPSDLEGKNFWNFIPEADRPHVAALLAKLTPDNPEAIIENRFETSAGPLWTRWVNRALTFDSSGKWLEAQSTGIDITERKLAEEKLAESEARYRNLAELVPAMLWVADTNGTNVDHTRKWLAYTGQTRDQALGDGWKDIVHPDDLERVGESWSKSLNTGMDFLIEYRIRRASDGAYRWHHVEGSPQRDEQGKPYKWFGACIDIEKRKQAEAALHKSELRHRTLVHATSALTWSCPPSGLQVTPQPEWMAFAGQTAEEMLGDGWTKVVHPEDATSVGRRWLDAVGRGEPFVSEHRIRRHDGSWRWMCVHAAPIHDAAGAIVEWSGMNLDIKERREAEAAHRTVVNATSAITWRCPSSGLFVEPQPEWGAFTGQTAEEMLGDGWTMAIHPDDLAGAMPQRATRNDSRSI